MVMKGVLEIEETGVELKTKKAIHIGRFEKSWKYIQDSQNDALPCCTAIIDIDILSFPIDPQ